MPKAGDFENWGMAVDEWTDEDELDARDLQAAIGADDGGRFTMAEVMEMARESE